MSDERDRLPFDRGAAVQAMNDYAETLDWLTVDWPLDMPREMLGWMRTMLAEIDRLTPSSVRVGSGISTEEHRRLRALHHRSPFTKAVMWHPPLDEYGRPTAMKNPYVTCACCNQPWPCETIEWLDADIAARTPVDILASK